MENVIEFLVFALLQAMFIVGLKNTFEPDMILHSFYKWVKSSLGDYWSKPFVGCIRCMSSVYGFLTFWPAVIIKYQWDPSFILLFVFDVFVLVYLTFYLYKKQ